MGKPIRKIGNSQGIILPKELLDSIGINIGDVLNTRVKNGKIILDPVVEK